MISGGGGRAEDADYATVLRELEARGMMPSGPLSLDPMHEAFRRVVSDFLEPSRVLIVAGTNGKGSVSATLDALFADAGIRVGLYTSPHLVEVTERFRVAGQDISRDVFRRAYHHVAKATLDLRLTHFEMLTVMAAWIFSSPESGLDPVEQIILEVGLGGLWDATNAIPHGPAVITQLGYDHQNLLGDSLAEIARNKFGVVTEGGLVVHAPLPEGVQAEVQAARARTASRWIPCASHRFLAKAGMPPDFRIETEWGESGLALPGARGAANAALALTAFQALGYDPRPAIARGVLSRVRWPGRMHLGKVRGAPCPVYFSGDHNRQGVESLIELLPYYERGHLHLVVGIGQDKSVDEMLGALFALPDASIHLTTTPYRGGPVEAYPSSWRERAASCDADPHRALSRACAQAGSQDLIVVTGSLYLVGELMRRSQE